MKKSPSCGFAVARKTLDLDPDADDKLVEDALMKAQFSPEQQQLRELDMNMRGQTNDIQNNIVKYVSA